MDAIRARNQIVMKGILLPMWIEIVMFTKWFSTKSKLMPNEIVMNAKGIWN